MKVIVLTYQFANNHGAILQAHALSHFLKESGVNCETLQYFPKGWDRSWSIFPKPRSFRDFLKNIYLLFNVRLVAEKRKSLKSYEYSITTLLNLTKEKYDKNIIDKYPKADVCICGSDQIWNLSLFDDWNYFLAFIKDKSIKKIAYAPSIGNEWQAKDLHEIQMLLQDFDYLSVREKADVEVVKKLSGRPVEWVVDPIFLMPMNYWMNLAEKPKISAPYIFCYFLGVEDVAVKIVQRIKTVTGYPIVYVNLMALDRLGADYCLRNVTTQQFLGYLSEASVVCTNSFHCTAFSLLFRKNFCVVSHTERAKRMKSLQEQFGVENRFFDNDKIEISDLQIDYSRCDRLYDKVISKSRNYLLESILSDEGNNSCK